MTDAKVVAWLSTEISLAASMRSVARLGRHLSLSQRDCTAIPEWARRPQANKCEATTAMVGNGGSASSSSSSSSWAPKSSSFGLSDVALLVYFSLLNWPPFTAFRYPAIPGNTQRFARPKSSLRQQVWQSFRAWGIGWGLLGPDSQESVRRDRG